MKITKIPPAPVEPSLCLEVTAFELEVIHHCLAYVCQVDAKTNPASRTAARLFDEIENTGVVSFDRGRISSRTWRETLLLSVRSGAVLPEEGPK